ARECEHASDSRELATRRREGGGERPRDLAGHARRRARDAPGRRADGRGDRYPRHADALRGPPAVEGGEHAPPRRRPRARGAPARGQGGAAWLERRESRASTLRRPRDLAERERGASPSAWAHGPAERERHPARLRDARGGPPRPPDRAPGAERPAALGAAVLPDRRR